MSMLMFSQYMHSLSKGIVFLCPYDSCGVVLVPVVVVMLG